MKLNLINSFNNFFNTSFLIISKNNNQITYSSIGNYYIVFSYFHVFLNRAIFLSTSDSIKIVIEESLFSNCNHNLGNGGAIYFSCLNSEIVLNKICGYSCTIGSGLQYGYFIHSETGTSLKHEYYYNSITSCKIETPSHEQSAIYSLKNGLIIQKNTNCSNCKTRSYTFLLIWSSPLSNYSFINIFNTNSYYARLIEYQNVIFEGNNFNIINHTQLTINQPVFLHYNSGYSIFKNFIILNCTLSDSYNLFYNQSCDPFQLFNCYINIGSFSNVITNLVFKTNTNTFNYNYFSTIFCNTNNLIKTKNKKIYNILKFKVLYLIYY